LLSHPVSDKEIDKAWCAMLLQFPPGKITLLRELAPRYRLYLFSNTNSIHIGHFHELFRKQFGFHLTELFVKDYYSSEIKLRKPNPEAFRYVLNDAGLNPAETLFIDDFEQNIATARNAGYFVLHYIPGTDLTGFFLSELTI